MSYEISEESLDRLVADYPDCLELAERVAEFKEEFIDLGNDVSNYTFEDAMTFDDACQMLDAPGWGWTTSALDAIEGFDRWATYKLAEYGRPIDPNDPLIEY